LAMPCCGNNSTEPSAAATAAAAVARTGQTLCAACSANKHSIKIFLEQSSYKNRLSTILCNITLGWSC
jgi:hypothetical protein